ncbi:ATP12 family chaperone protein [Sinisalibacter lacisalsi]|uniref:ATPase n=1 Tax=Sinisalibacter lacisalsi TaxID=1526570 RepID=A0ABQ1QE48_9RHOB|nr:ATP12 family protein [Sinisalibacter lacisalsi]GGD24648.1 ATPase [Sinisalibacter lacisalsi]
MSGAWQPKRFWSEAAVKTAEGGFTVVLDDRPVRTPGKADLVMPTRALAEAVAAEWDAQEGLVKPQNMPLTRTVNSAIDKVSAQHAEIGAMIAAYGETDLLCYRAEAPEGLVDRQAKAWDPFLDWAAIQLGARLRATTGIVPVPQDAEAMTRLAAQTRDFDAFSLAGFHDLVALSGSLILGFATVHRLKDPEEIWEISRIDEAWQQAQWGEDEEAAEHTALKKQAFLDAARFFSLLERDD